ncbi:hypothetical protein NC652_015273 [Populus alba x Populus x berolinensis]|nr:hypothetical protein NC652_015273 [Populus alba x Populus x berolinensis]
MKASLPSSNHFLPIVEIPQGHNPFKSLEHKSGLAAQLLSTQNIRPFLDSAEVFLFDCDGVIWKGDKLIDGVSQTMDFLRSKGKKTLVFVINNSLNSRRQYAKKFHSLWVSVDEMFNFFYNMEALAILSLLLLVSYIWS